ncbi:MAG TPA: hypothetical protein DEP66_01360, partial [Acidimicrobiaceae bacterium]|nr:hypothetical protein [Acidimicrobiaceae bacterium]
AQTMLSTLRARYGTAGVEWTGDGRLLLTDPNAPPGSGRSIQPWKFLSKARNISDEEIRRSVHAEACTWDDFTRALRSGEIDEWKPDALGLTLQHTGEGATGSASDPVMRLPTPEELGLVPTVDFGAFALSASDSQIDRWRDECAAIDITETALRNSLDGDYHKMPPFEFECPATGEMISIETYRGSCDNPFLSGCLADLSGFNTGGAQGILVNVPSTHTLQIAPVGVGHPQIVLGAMSTIRRFAYRLAPGGLFEHSDRPLSKAVLWWRPGQPLVCLDGDGDDSGRPKLEELLTAWGGPYLDEFRAS